MARNSISHETLTAMYNRLVAAHKSLQEQIKEKESCWAAQERQYIHTISAARTLCEMIVAKVPNSDFLGKSFSWSSLSADDLITRAKKTFVEYNAERTDEIRRLEELIRTLQSSNENLQTQLEYALNSTPHPKENKSLPNEISEKVRDEQMATPGIVEQPKTLPDRTSKDIRDAMKKGTVDVHMIEEDADVSPMDELQQSEMAEMGAMLQIDAGRPPIQTSKKSKNTKDAAIIATVNNSVMTDVSKIEESITDRRWEIIKAIGDTGLYFSKDIFETVLKKSQDEVPKSESTKISVDLHNLNMCGVIKKEAIQNPIVPKMSVYYLTSIGAILYERHYGKKPSESQLKQIANDHDNLEHGLGILTLAELFEKSPIFTHISTDRKQNSITLRTGDVFVPDIVAKTARYTAYFEYERGTHNTTNIRIKLNKMAIATNFLNIITPDIKACEILHKKVLSWIESRGGLGFLPKHTVRITPVNKIKNVIKNGGDINAADTWTYSYDLGVKTTHQKEG